LLIAFMHELPTKAWQILALILLLFFIILCYAIYQNIQRIIKFIKDPNYIIQELKCEENIRFLEVKTELTHEARTAIMNSSERIGAILVYAVTCSKFQNLKKTLYSVKRLWFELGELEDKARNDVMNSFEGIGAILVYEVNCSNNNLVLQNLQKLSDSGKKLLVAANSLKTEDDIQCNETRLFFETPINQFAKIYEAAIKSQNEELAIYTLRHMQDILISLTSRPNNERYIEAILERPVSLIQFALKHQNESVCVAFSKWYPDVVLESQFREEKFDPEYLSQFNLFLYTTSKYIIAENAFSVFKKFIEKIVNGLSLLDIHPKTSVWDLYGLIHGKILHHEFNALYKSTNSIFSKTKWDDWWKQFQLLKSKIPEDKQKEADELENKIRAGIIPKYKHVSLLHRIFIIGAYCLFEKRYDFIKTIWQYKQPPDAGATYCGSNIIPESVSDLIEHYLRPEVLDFNDFFWKDRHGSKKYCQQYFLFSLAYYLKPLRIEKKSGECEFVKNYKLPVERYENNELSNIKYFSEHLIKEIPDLKKNTDLFDTFDFEANRVNEILDNRVEPLLKNIKDQSNNELEARKATKLTTTPISNKLIKEYKDDVKASFYKKKQSIKIFQKYFGADSYDKSKLRTPIDSDKRDDPPRFGISSIYNRDIFFEEPGYITFGSSDKLGVSHGRTIARDEDSSIFQQICDKCTPIDKGDFPNILDNFNIDDIIIILAGSGPTLYYFINAYDHCTINPSDESSDDITEHVYHHKGRAIPLIKADKRGDDFVLILNKRKVGKLLQLSPLNEKSELDFLNDIFYMNIRDLLDPKHDEYREEVLKNPDNQKWLAESSKDVDHQRKYLKQCVSIQIFERFKYEPADPEDFQRYKIDIETLNPKKPQEPSQASEF